MFERLPTIRAILWDPFSRRLGRDIHCVAFFTGANEDEARAHMYDYLGGNRMRLVRFDDYWQLVDRRAQELEAA